jgi:ABC-type transport system involved in cytochrome c biogenesis permease subunit
MVEILGRVTEFCFAASYVVALVLELVQIARPRPVQRLAALVFGGAGLIAHTIFVALHPLPLATPFGSLVFLAWILAVFYFYGSIHHRRLAWGVFVLPVVLALVALAKAIPPDTAQASSGLLSDLLRFDRQFWAVLHGCLFILAAVGIAVGFVASLMYLVQVRRLKSKAAPGVGPRLFSLERLELMNRRALLLAFPLLTIGLLISGTLLLQSDTGLSGLFNPLSPKILSTVGSWLLFAVLLYLRYGVHVRGRQMAILTIVAFVLMVVALASPVHPFAQGDGP